MKKLLLVGIVFSLCGILASCVGETAQKNEEIQFLLDRGQFSEAIIQARIAVAASTEGTNENTQAKFLLASALIGDSVLNQSVRCKATDTGYLGLIACLLDQPAGAQTGFATFARIAPATTTKLIELEEARDILISLGASATGTSRSDTFLQLYVSRLFEIATTTTKIGANTTNIICATFKPFSLTAAEVARFQDNLANVNQDATNAGLPASFTVNARVIDALNALTTAIQAAGNATIGAGNFFNDQFGQNCP